MYIYIQKPHFHVIHNWAMDELFWFISSVMFLTAIMPLRN